MMSIGGLWLNDKIDIFMSQQFRVYILVNDKEQIWFSFVKDRFKGKAQIENRKFTHAFSSQ